MYGECRPIMCLESVGIPVWRVCTSKNTKNLKKNRKLETKHVYGECIPKVTMESVGTPDWKPNKCMESVDIFMCMESVGTPVWRVWT